MEPPSRRGGRNARLDLLPSDAPASGIRDSTRCGWCCNALTLLWKRPPAGTAIFLAF
jgi:hypothetical protein